MGFRKHRLFFRIYKLEKTFNKHKYLDPTKIIKTAAKLNLSETQNHGNTGQRLSFIPTALASYQHPMQQILTQHAQHPMHPICY
ncbi:hypothetical protein SKAU_G00163730 [Synaphobranchus kaupii]|uniref:Homeobox domain-containing protein n=1 Tax=Synaphobranchus kaupii TaxID=118154 RepID=A0A9Q1FJ74_SYNKA|nr:hypothetical protein SKAU_G00163730 [Synaphobranchus kaupii]